MLNFKALKLPYHLWMAITLKIINCKKIDAVPQLAER